MEYTINIKSKHLLATILADLIMAEASYECVMDEENEDPGIDTEEFYEHKRILYKDLMHWKGEDLCTLLNELDMDVLSEFCFEAFHYSYTDKGFIPKYAWNDWTLIDDYVNE